MTDKTPYNESEIYPGSYIPIGEIDYLLTNPGSHPEDTLPAQPSFVEELDDHFKIETVLSGIQRENILVYVHKELISILLIHAGNNSLAECRHRHIRLPGTIDTGFISAAYHDGVLHIYVPKINSPVACAIDYQQVAVY